MPSSGHFTSGVGWTCPWNGRLPSASHALPGVLDRVVEAIPQIYVLFVRVSIPVAVVQLVGLPFLSRVTIPLQPVGLWSL